MLAPAEEEGTPEVPLAAVGVGTMVPDVATGTGTVVPEVAIGVGTVEPDTAVVDVEGWVDAGIPDSAVVLAEDEGGALDGVSRSNARQLVEPMVAGKTDWTARWTVSSTSCCS